MTKKETDSVQAAVLRKKAEKIAREKAGLSQKNMAAIQPDEIRQTLYELRVHQVELEMQNEELQRAQKELDAVRARYFDLYDLAPVGYMIVSKQGLILESNLTAATMLGVARSVLFKRQLTRFILKEDQDIYYRHRKQLFDTSEPQTCELRMVKNDGSIFWAHLEAIAAQDNQGEPVCRVVLTDITESKKTEENIKKINLHQQTLLAAIPDIIMEVDINKIYTWANESGIEFFGKNVIGKAADFYFVQEQDTYDHVQPLFEGNDDIIYLESWQRRKDGQERLLAWWCHVLKDLEGNVIGALSSARDITDRKLAEEKLRASEENFRRSLDESLLGVLILNLEGETLYANQATLEIYGYDNIDELKRTPVEARYTPESYAAFQIRSEKIRRGESVPSEYEISIVRKNGEIRHIHIYRKEIVWNGARQFQIIYQDITGRKLIEALLLKSEANYRQLFDNAPSAIYQIDFRTGKFVKANDLICEYLGYTREEITSISPYDVLTHESKQLFLERLETMGLGKKVIDDPEYEVVDRNGKRRWLQLNSKNIYDSEGLAGADVVAHDITERKQAEEKLRSEHFMLMRAEYIANIGSWEWDIETDTVKWSDELFRIFQREPREGAPSFSEHPAFYHPDDMARLHLAVEAAVADGTPYELELRAIRKDGETRVCIARGVAELKLDGSPVRLFGSLQDISERKQGEEKLKETMDRLRKAVGATIQVMASAVEIRDPYTAGHQIRSAGLARAIATDMGLSQDKIEGIRVAASIHDIGKLSIPSELLSKPTKLSVIECSLIKEHAQKGYDILKNIESPWPLAEIVYQHHERMDGSGYPRKLKGNDILIEARILIVADVVEAMASHRPYRPALGLAAALEEIVKNRGTLYDEAVVDACLRLFREKGYQLEVT